jgi:hypothetical protein
MFSTLTGGRLGYKFLPAAAARIIDNLTAKFEFVELNQTDAKKALSEAQGRGVQGGQIHDWMHAVAAKKSGATELLTLNITDLLPLRDGFTVNAP